MVLTHVISEVKVRDHLQFALETVSCELTLHVERSW